MNEAHQQFCEAYGIEDPPYFAKLYELDEIVLFLPSRPSEEERDALLNLIGLQGETYGFLDYAKSNNTFELIMQWREATDNL